MNEWMSKVTGMEQANQLIGVCAAADLTDFPRCGVRGPNSGEVLRHSGYVVPQKANTAIEQPSGEMLARLSSTEYLLLGARECQSPLNIGFSGDQLQDQDRFYRLERFDSHAWFMVTGALSSQLLAKLCGVDLRLESNPLGSVVQTSVARTSAIVIRQSLGQIDSLNLLVDRSVRAYFRDVIDDAMREFGGRFIDVSMLSREICTVRKFDNVRSSMI